VLPGEDPRAGRWRGWDKVECGIHSPVSAITAPVADPDDPANQPVF
jgi:phosphoadenosine phosphosulfate reductase